MSPEEQNKFAHEALMKELHKADDLVETHSQLVIAISSAALGFAATQFEKNNVVYFVAFFGVFIAIEWILKIRRHRQIFNDALSELRKVEDDLGLPHKTARKKPEKGISSGFDTLLLFASVLIIMWLSLGFGAYDGWFNKKPMSASQVVEEALKELPTLTNQQNCKWAILSMNWDVKTHTYNLVVECTPQSLTWLLTYDTSGRVITSERK